MEFSGDPRNVLMRAKPRSRLHLFAVCASVTWSVVAVGGCNALSGIGDFTVQSEAGRNGAGDAARPGDGAMDSTDGPREGPVETTRSEGGDAPLDGLREAGDAEVDGGDAADSAVDASTTCGTHMCSTPLCCDGGCANTHSDGLGHFFYDCVPPGTFNLTQAFAACAAFTGNMSQCNNDPIACSSGDQVCSSGAPMCACWRYNGNGSGHVLDTGATCQCFGSNSPTWN
jgi:hypothetical protein